MAAGSSHIASFLILEREFFSLPSSASLEVYIDLFFKPTFCVIDFFFCCFYCYWLLFFYISFLLPAMGCFVFVSSSSFLVSFLFIFLLKDNCFTEFHCFLSNLNMIQPYVYIYPLPFEPPSHPPPHLTPLGWYRAGLSFLSHTANSCWLSILHTVM